MRISEQTKKDMQAVTIERNDEGGVVNVPAGILNEEDSTGGEVIMFEIGEMEDFVNQPDLNDEELRYLGVVLAANIETSDRDDVISIERSNFNDSFRDMEADLISEMSAMVASRGTKWTMPVKESTDLYQPDLIVDHTDDTMRYNSYQLLCLALEAQLMRLVVPEVEFMAREGELVYRVGTTPYAAPKWCREADLALGLMAQYGVRVNPGDILEDANGGGWAVVAVDQGGRYLDSLVKAMQICIVAKTIEVLKARQK